MLELSQCKLSWQEDSFSKLQKKAAKLLGIYTVYNCKTQSGCQKKAESFCIIYCEVFVPRGIGSSEKKSKE